MACDVCPYSIKCKDCEELVENYGFCTLLMRHVVEPLHYLSFYPPVETNKIKIFILSKLIYLKGIVSTN